MPPIGRRSTAWSRSLPSSDERGWEVGRVGRVGCLPGKSPVVTHMLGPGRMAMGPLSPRFSNPLKSFVRNRRGVGRVGKVGRGPQPLLYFYVHASCATNVAFSNGGNRTSQSCQPSQSIPLREKPLVNTTEVQARRSTQAGEAALAWPKRKAGSCHRPGRERPQENHHAARSTNPEPNFSVHHARWTHHEDDDARPPPDRARQWPRP